MPSGPFLPAHAGVEGGPGQGVGTGRKLAENGRAQTCGASKRPAYAPCRGVRPPIFTSHCVRLCPSGVSGVKHRSAGASGGAGVTVRDDRRPPGSGRCRCDPTRCDETRLVIKESVAGVRSDASGGATPLTGSSDLRCGGGAVGITAAGGADGAAEARGAPPGVRTGAGRGIAIRATLRHAPGNACGPGPPRGGVPAARGRSGQQRSSAVLLGYRLGKMIPSRIVPL